MNKRQVSTLAIVGALGMCCCVQGAESSTAPERENAKASPFYKAQEVSVDLFGSASVGQQAIDHITGDRLDHDSRLGAGVGLNYFFTRHFGIGGDVYTENTAHNFVDSASGNLIARLPLGQSGIAPYVFGGGGYQFDQTAQKFAQAGAGIEFRFVKHAGFFLDGRYVFANRTEDYGVFRAGLRVSF